ncbi:natural killer cells antigen CD94-like [Talpa occidentalis]|uniref:natural killer cells antigen CD94-like n=1 Tax=Talpa occidentalis TaxID=50954 RepID=UPI0023F901FF|nr:natural killer cells antigen CD94-like [Talpa occidentalis]
MAEFWNTLWRWISGILGVTCLSLIIILGILLNNTFHQETIKSTSPAEPSTQFQEGTDCYFCQERWIGSMCNCYFVSSDLETWEESRNFCASNNSTLLQMDNRDELACI